MCSSALSCCSLLLPCPLPLRPVCLPSRLAQTRFNFSVRFDPAAEDADFSVLVTRPVFRAGDPWWHPTPSTPTQNLANSTFFGVLSSESQKGEKLPWFASLPVAHTTVMCAECALDTNAVPAPAPRTQWTGFWKTPNVSLDC
jgi:hypothetical protein